MEEVLPPEEKTKLKIERFYDALVVVCSILERLLIEDDDFRNRIKNMTAKLKIPPTQGKEYEITFAILLFVPLSVWLLAQKARGE